MPFPGLQQTRYTFNACLCSAFYSIQRVGEIGGRLDPPRYSVPNWAGASQKNERAARDGTKPMHDCITFKTLGQPFTS